MNLLVAAKTILGLLPAIIDAVKAIEAAFPEGGKGQAKLELVKTTLQTAYDYAEDKVGSFDAVWKMVQPVVGAVVAFANNTGLFKK